jgi:uncharacterized protein (TIGR02118 family)
MYALSFMYPTKTGVDFDWDHYTNVHLPLGAGLTDKLMGLKIKQMIVQRVHGAGEAGSNAPYYVLCHAMFETKEDVDKFSTLFNFPEAKTRLSQDWPKYTPHDPDAIVSEWIVMDNIDEMISRFKNELEPAETASASAA